MKTLVVCNQKGGVGKTAVTTLLAHHLVHRGKRVLAIDLDHQGNLSKPLRLSGRPTVAGVGASSLLTGPVPEIPSEPFVLVPADGDLMFLERQPDKHTPFARTFRRFLAAVDGQFDVCVVDTHPNPDIRLISALASADFALSPIQLNKEALDGVKGLVDHERVGVRKIKAVLNPKLSLIGLLPTMVEPTPFQRANFVEVIRKHHHLMIAIGDAQGAFASIPKRSSIAEAQASGEVLWEIKKTAARDAWREIEPSLTRIAHLVNASAQNATRETVNAAAA